MLARPCLSTGRPLRRARLHGRSLSGRGGSCPRCLLSPRCPRPASPRALCTPRGGPLLIGVRSTRRLGAGGCCSAPPPPAHRGPLTDLSAPQYACWGAARGHWALRGHSWVPLMSPRAAVPDPPVCGRACPAGGVSVCLAYPGFGAPFVCLGFARPCLSPQGCECHRQPCQALDLCLGSFAHIERSLWSPRWSVCAPRNPFESAPTVRFNNPKVLALLQTMSLIVLPSRRGCPAGT